MKVKEILRRLKASGREEENKNVKLEYEACISYLEKWLYLKEKGIIVDDVQLFDQYNNLKSFVQDKNEQFFKTLNEQSAAIIIKLYWL